MGDPVRVLEAGVIIDAVQSHNLLQLVRDAGAHLKAGLERLQVHYSKVVSSTPPSDNFVHLSILQTKYPGVVSNVRGVGTFLAFDLKDPATQGKVLAQMRHLGVEATGSGSRSFRVRPMLVFTPRHADQLLERLDTCFRAVQ